MPISLPAICSGRGIRLAFYWHCGTHRLPGTANLLGPWVSHPHSHSGWRLSVFDCKLICGWLFLFLWVWKQLCAAKPEMVNSAWRCFKTWESTWPCLASPWDTLKQKTQCTGYQRPNEASVRWGLEGREAAGRPSPILLPLIYDAFEGYMRGASASELFQMAWLVEGVCLLLQSRIYILCLSALTVAGKSRTGAVSLPVKQPAPRSLDQHMPPSPCKPE